MNISIKALALAAALTAGLTACQKDNLVSPSQPQANSADANALSGGGGAANTRTQYRLVKVDYQSTNGSPTETNFFYDRANQLFKVANSWKIITYSYGANNSITALTESKLQNQPFKKQSLMTYYLGANGRAYKVNVKYFDKNETLYPGSGTEYNYLYNGNGQLVKTYDSGFPMHRDTLIYNGNGDLTKEMSFDHSGVPTFEQQFYYDKPGSYASDLQPSGPRVDDPALKGLIPDYLPLNPWNLWHVDEFLPIFGKFRKHLPKRFIQFSTPGQPANGDTSYGYVLNADGYATERKTKHSTGSQSKHTYNFLETEISLEK